MVELVDTQVSGICGSNPVGVRVPPSAILSIKNMKKGRIAVFLSGRGSNFEAIYNYSRKEKANFEIAAVISNKKYARGLQRAEDFGIDAYFVSRKKAGSKKNYELEIVKILKEHQIDLICLAGYMKIIGEILLREFPARIINIHPALLPSFPGLNAQRQALEYGVKISGCTVHFVDSGIDTGPIILQEAVKIDPADDEDSLSKKILVQEHKIYSKVIELFFQGRLNINEKRIKIKEK